MKRSYLLPLASVIWGLAYHRVPRRGKSDDTLNVAIDRELESIDNYYNTAREGIVISRMVWDALLYRDPKPTNTCQIWQRPTSGLTPRHWNLISAKG